MVLLIDRPCQTRFGGAISHQETNVELTICITP